MANDSLPAGKRLGPYEILSPLGAGGMGEVYLARDTRLDRTVAIKILPAGSADRPGLRERFEREARAVSGLNHPHICTLHDIGREDGIDFLVMEHIEGETLAERLGRGPLPPSDVLALGCQIAGALAGAHRRGIVHRDLKPGNIMLTRSGAKLLDFGLAKQESIGGLVTDRSSMPTQHKELTAEGAILGTLQYMAPEQLEGKESDARTDIFALGAVLYEMATGRKAFSGQSQASLIASILSTQPPSMAELQPMTPTALDWAIRTCLSKDPDDRWQSARDLELQLERIRQAGADEAPVPAGARSGGLAWAAAGLAAGILLTAGIAAALSSAPRPEPVRRLAISVPGEIPRNKTTLDHLALAPDGTTLVFAAGEGDTWKLYARPLDMYVTRAIAGSEGGRYPAFSTGGEQLVFSVQGSMMALPVSGGTPRRLCAVSDPIGTTWADDGHIYFSNGWGDGLYRVPETGGERQVVDMPDVAAGELGFLHPFALPGSRGLVMSVWTGGPVDDSRIVYQPLPDGPRKTLVEGASMAIYLSSGHLLYARGGSVFAVPFDPDSAEITGVAIAVFEGVMTRTGNGRAALALSASGTIAYVSGELEFPRRRLGWVDRSGGFEVLNPPGRGYADPRLSPDGRKVAVSIQESTYDIWTLDMARETLTRLTYTGDEINPVWSPDGRWIVFNATPSGNYNIFRKAADGTGEPERLTTSELDQYSLDISPDGRWHLFSQTDPVTRSDLMILDLEGDHEVRPFLKTPFSEDSAAFSPGGKWLAYVSDESGRREVYVQSFPGPGGKYQISTSGGSHPLWARDAGTLYYWDEKELMSVALSTSPEFTAGRPAKVLSGEFVGDSWDIGPDGRFLLAKDEQEGRREQQIQLVTNWAEELRRRVPGP